MSAAVKSKLSRPSLEAPAPSWLEVRGAASCGLHRFRAGTSEIAFTLPPLSTLFPEFANVLSG